MDKSRVLVHIALFAALTCALTLFPSFPVGILPGYIHMGDAVVVLSAYFIGKKSIVSAAVGSALADVIFAGALIYVPATLVIKGLMAFVAYLIMNRKPGNLAVFLLSVLAAELCMLAGYFLYETALYGAALAAAAVTAGLAQAAGAIIFSGVIFKMVKGTNLKKYFQDF